MFVKSGKRRRSIFSLAKTLNHEMIDEVIRLYELHQNTSHTLFRTVVPLEKREPFYTAKDWVDAQRSATNLPKRGLVEFLTTLSHEQRIELTALTWLGRDDGPPGTVRQSYKALLRHSKRMYNPDSFIDYLIHKPLNHYLRLVL